MIFCSFGDMLRVPGSDGDLFTIKSQGGDVRVVYSPLDCLKIARSNPDKRVVFFAIGFETTAPANAMLVWQARQSEIKQCFRSGVACAGSSRARGNLAVSGKSRAGIPRSRTCLRRYGIQRL